jgi:proteic killer suppression protein
LLHERGDFSRVDARYAKKLAAVLARMSRATRHEDLRVSGYRLHQLSGDRAGWWSIRVSANWRIIFRIEGDTLYDIDYVDYHGR